MNTISIALIKLTVLMNNSICYVVATVLLILIYVKSSQAQTRYVVQIKTINGETIKGKLLFAAGDSIGVNRKSIKSIFIHKKGKMSRSILIGSGIGAATGALTFLVVFRDECANATNICLSYGPEVDALVGGVLGAIGGAVTGAIVGAHSKQVKINSDPAKFDYFKAMYFPEAGTPLAVKP